MSAPPTTAGARSAPGAGALRLVIHHRLAACGLALLALILLGCLLTPWLPLSDPHATDPFKRLLPPLSPGHLLGTDHLGRDLLARLCWGTRASLAVGVCAMLISALAGSLIGLAAGFFAGRTDTVLMRSIDMLMAFPYILLALAIVVVLGPGLLNALYAIAIVNLPFFARNIRGVTVGLRRREFIDAARLSGKGPLALLFTEVLPNVAPVIVITMSTTLGWMILETAGLSFLGLGAQPPHADLGSMLGQGRMQLFIAPQVALVPGVAIFILVLCINLLGDGVRDALDPRLRAGDQARPNAATRVERAQPPRRKEAAAALLEVDGLQVEFGDAGRRRAAVKGVSFSLARGECLGLIGESGSGKSVTALALTRLVASPPGVISAGAVRLDGEELLELPAATLRRRRGARIAYVFQDPLTTLHPMMPVGEQVIEAIRAHQPLSYRSARARAIELLGQVGLTAPEERFHRYPHELSGGQRQRIGISMALANDPQVIVADEPTTALDVTVQARILELLERLRRERGVALLFITHDFGVVRRICDRVAVMRDGEIVESGPTAQLLADPQHPYTRRLIECVPQLGQGRSFLARVEGLFESDRLEGGVR